MFYIRNKESVSSTSITVCIMERHQAGQEETLVKVMLEPDSLEVVHLPRGSPADHRGCFKCAVVLATVMGLVIAALVVGFILHFFMFMPSCSQDTPPLSDTAGVHMPLTKSDEQGRYDIVTVDKAAIYLIYGWVKFSDVTDEEVTLKQKLKDNNRTIQKKTTSETEIFFFDKVLLASGSRISIYFKSTYTDSLFHVYEL